MEGDGTWVVGSVYPQKSIPTLDSAIRLLIPWNVALHRSFKFERWYFLFFILDNNFLICSMLIKSIISQSSATTYNASIKDDIGQSINEFKLGPVSRRTAAPSTSIRLPPVRLRRDIVGVHLFNRHTRPARFKSRGQFTKRF